MGYICIEAHPVLVDVLYLLVKCNQPVTLLHYLFVLCLQFSFLTFYQFTFYLQIFVCFLKYLSLMLHVFILLLYFLGPYIDHSFKSFIFEKQTLGMVPAVDICDGKQTQNQKGKEPASLPEGRTYC